MESAITPKLLARLESRYQRSNNLSEQEIQALQKYYQADSKAFYSKVASTSILCTSVLVASRLGGKNTPALRALKLSFYVTTPIALKLIYGQIHAETTKEQFKLLSSLVNAEDLAGMQRAWRIKTKEFDEEKKALQKYKFDPQSYH